MTRSRRGAAQRWSPWRVIVWFGVVSLAADLVYEGARSLTGPYLASLGASAFTVGVVTGAGEAAALGFRLLSGPYADRRRRYWSLTIVGYAMTAMCVPLMALAPLVGAAGLALASTLLILERTGKAVRSPAKSALLARVAADVGRGRGIAVHKALDQIGAVAGPLLVAGVVALTSALWAGFAILAVPGAIAVAVVLVLWVAIGTAGSANSAVPIGVGKTDSPPAGSLTTGHRGLGRGFYLLAGACAANTFGLMNFGILSFHLAETDLVAVAVVPLVYAAAMAVEALAALATGFGYDRWSGWVLVAVPVLVATAPWLAFGRTAGAVICGVLVWGGATGILESTVKALVADLVPGRRLATAYGTFAAIQGVAALAGGALAGWLYADGQRDLALVIAGTQLVALVALAAALRHPDNPPP
ncbi:MAG: MFS transporter [Nocardioides sp.]